MTSWLVRLFCLRAASQQGLSPPPCAPPPATQASRHLSKRKKSARVGRARIAKKKAHRLRPEKERNVFSFYLCIQDACATQLGCAVVARARAGVPVHPVRRALVQPAVGSAADSDRVHHAVPELREVAGESVSLDAEGMNQVSAVAQRRFPQRASSRPPRRSRNTCPAHHCVKSPRAESATGTRCASALPADATRHALCSPSCARPTRARARARARCSSDRCCVRHTSNGGRPATFYFGNALGACVPCLGMENTRASRLGPAVFVAGQTATRDAHLGKVHP